MQNSFATRLTQPNSDQFPCPFAATALVFFSTMPPCTSQLRFILALVLLVNIMPASESPPLIIAHRGESHLAPENTHAAFDLAWKQGAAAIELDVHLTADDQVVVCHDEDTYRTTGKITKQVIASSTYAQLRTLDVGAWKAPAYAGEKLPLLSEVLARTPAQGIVFIELKPNHKALVPATIAVMKASGRAPDLMPVICFHPPLLAEFRQQWPDGSPTYLLVELKKSSPTVDTLVAAATACKANGLDLQNRPIIDKAFIATVHAAGMRCYIWTEDDPTAAKVYADAPAHVRL